MATQQPILDEIRAEFEEIDKAFAPSSRQLRPKKRAKTTQVFLEGGELPEERNIGFFETEDVEKLSPNIYIRRHYNEKKGQFFIYFMKKNFLREDSNVDDTFLNCSAFELPDLIEILKKLIKEVQNTPFRSLPKRLECSQDCYVEDRENPRYWSLDFTETLPSGNLRLRIVREKNGTFIIRINSPRTTNYRWTGPTMSIPVGSAEEFVTILQSHLNQIEEIESNKLQID